MYTREEFTKRHTRVSSSQQWIAVAESYERDAWRFADQFFNRRNVDISNGHADQWRQEMFAARFYAVWAREEARFFRAPSTMTITAIDDPRPLMVRVADRMRSVFGL
jgi:hypothetical protein